MEVKVSNSQSPESLDIADIALDDLATLKIKLEESNAKNLELEYLIAVLQDESKKTQKLHNSHIAIERIENKQLKGHISDLQGLLDETKKELQEVKTLTVGKALIEENLRDVISQGEEERKDLESENHRLAMLCKEKEEYVEILSKRIARETEISSKLQEELDATNAVHEKNISSLEDTVLLLENEVRVINQRASKELETARHDRLGLNIKLQV